MCVAIYQPVEKPLVDGAIVNGWVNNPDGGGFAYINPETSRIEVFKAMTLYDFEDAYEEAWEKYGGVSPFLVHMRWATTGSVKKDNCHPFPVWYPGEDRGPSDQNPAGTAQTYMIHNGVIGIPTMDGDKSDRTDTQFFVDEFLSKLPRGWLDDEHLTSMVSDFVGSGSKLVFLTVDPTLTHTVYVINQNTGVERGGVWYSNTSAFPSTVRRFNPATGRSPLVVGGRGRKGGTLDPKAQTTSGTRVGCEIVGKVNGQEVSAGGGDWGGWEDDWDDWDNWGDSRGKDPDEQELIRHVMASSSPTLEAIQAFENGELSRIDRLFGYRFTVEQADEMLDVMSGLVGSGDLFDIPDSDLDEWVQFFDERFLDWAETYGEEVLTGGEGVPERVPDSGRSSTSIYDMTDEEIASLG